MTASHDDKLASLDWNINDTKEALQCAFGMSDWTGVIKYANQLKDLTRQRFDLVSEYERRHYVSPWGSASRHDAHQQTGRTT